MDHEYFGLNGEFMYFIYEPQYLISIVGVHWTCLKHIISPSFSFFSATEYGVTHETAAAGIHILTGEKTILIIWTEREHITVQWE